jgi:hypothetical protein
MANKIEIFIEVDPNGKGAAGIKKITLNLDEMQNKGNNAAANTGSGLNSLVSSITGVQLSLVGVVALIGELSKKGNEAYIEGAAAQRALETDAKKAKISFEDARKEAAAFGHDLGLSATEGEQGFSKLLRVAREAGDVQGIDRIRKHFEDLVAAYGLTLEETKTLENQLLTGQERGFKRLGIDDIKASYEKYAESVGRTVSQLTEQEKIQVRLNVLEGEAEKNRGAAEQFVNSQVGQWQKLGAAIKDDYLAIGTFINTAAVLKDIPFILQNPFNAVERYQQKLEQDRKVAEQKARNEALSASDTALRNAQLGNLRGELALDPTNQKLRFKNLDYLAADLGSDEAAAAQRDKFVEQYKALMEDKRLNTTTLYFAEQQFNTIRGIFSPEKQAQLQEDMNKLWDKFAKTAFTQLKDARKEAENLFGGLAEKYSGGSNPIVKVLVEAEENAKKLDKTFSLLGEKRIAELKAIEDAYVRQRTLGLQLDADLKASSERREAERLGNPNPRSLTGQGQRNADTFAAQLNAAVNSPNLRAMADAISKGLVGRREVSPQELLQIRYAQRNGLNYEQLTDEQKFLSTRGQENLLKTLGKNQAFFTDSGLKLDTQDVQQKTYEQIQKLTGLIGGGQEGRIERGALNDALVNLFQSLSPDFQARIATGGLGARTQRDFAGAFSGQADELQNKILDEIDKSRVADEALRGVRDDIAIIKNAQNKGLDSREADARLLAVTGALSPNEITGDVRRERIEALRRDADRNSKLTEDAMKATEKARVSTDNLVNSIDALAKEVRNPQNRKLLIELINKAKADVRTELYGSLNEEAQ